MLSFLSSVLDVLNTNKSYVDKTPRPDYKVTQRKMFNGQPLKGVKEVKNKNKFMGESHLEIRMRKLLERHFGFYFPNVRLDSMINHETKRKLELDLYCKELNLAIEVQGDHHYNPYSHFFDKHLDKRTKAEQFEDVRKKDHMKLRMCKEQGIQLVVIYDKYIKKNWLDDELLDYVLGEINRQTNLFLQ